MICTVSLVWPQPGVVKVHTKRLTPAGRFETEVEAELEFAKLPDPTAIVHWPVVVPPGLFPESEAVVPQTDWSIPALDAGACVLVMVTWAWLVEQAVATLHRNTLAPKPRLETPELANDVFEIVPDPLTKLHEPVPEAGTVAFKVAKPEHTV